MRQFLLRAFDWAILGLLCMWLIAPQQAASQASKPWPDELIVDVDISIVSKPARAGVVEMMVTLSAKRPFGVLTVAVLPTNGAVIEGDARQHAL